MTVEHALLHAGDLQRLDPAIIDGVAECMPGYLWVVDNSQDETGLPEYDDRFGECRLVRCGRCGRTEINVKARGKYRVPLRQGAEAECPECRSQLTVKHVSKGIKTIRDTLDAVWYQKSAIDPTVVVAMAAHCVRDCRDADEREPWALEPSVYVRGIAVFDARSGDDIRIQERPAWGNGACWGYEWKPVELMKALTFGDDGYSFHQTPRVYMSDTFETAIAGTPIARAWHEYYANGADSLPALHLITRRPCVEYMTKLGLESIVCAFLRGSLPPRTINWSGRGMAQVLRITKARLGEIKNRRIEITPELLAALHYIDRTKIPCDIATAAGVARSLRGRGVTAKSALKAAVERFPANRRAAAVKYIGKHGQTRIDIITDYWRMAADAGSSLDVDEDAFPRDIVAAHDRLIARIKDIKDAQKDMRIRERLEKLTEKYGFEFGGLILRPAASAAELVREGQVLHHCVGRYVDRYAAGQTVICVMRRAVEPDNPFRTVEIDARRGTVLQDRGLHNDIGAYDMRTPEYHTMLKLFWAAWAERKKKKTKRESAKEERRSA